jgi:general secretion pathway protein M
MAGGVMATERAFFSSLALREQAVLAVSLALILGGLIYLGVWKPLADAASRLRETNIATSATLARVVELAEQYRQLKAADALHEAREVSLGQTINAEVAAFGLRMARFQPGSQGDVEVRFDGMPFNDVLRWLHQLETEHAIGIRDLSVTPAGEAGLVNISVRLYPH